MTPERPVFQDLTQRRWNGFLMFGGSAVATLAFLAALLWVSVNSAPEIPPLQPGVLAVDLPPGPIQADPPVPSAPADDRIAALPPEGVSPLADVPALKPAVLEVSEPAEGTAFLPVEAETGPAPGLPEDDVLAEPVAARTSGAEAEGPSVPHLDVIIALDTPEAPAAGPETADVARAAGRPRDHVAPPFPARRSPAVAAAQRRPVQSPSFVNLAAGSGRADSVRRLTTVAP